MRNAWSYIYDVMDEACILAALIIGYYTFKKKGSS